MIILVILLLILLLNVYSHINESYLRCLLTGYRGGLVVRWVVMRYDSYHMRAYDKWGLYFRWLDS